MSYSRTAVLLLLLAAAALSECAEIDPRYFWLEGGVPAVTCSSGRIQLTPLTRPSPANSRVSQLYTPLSSRESVFTASAPQNRRLVSVRADLLSGAEESGSAPRSSPERIHWPKTQTEIHEHSLNILV